MATHITTPTRAEVASLLRALLRTARKFPDYNIREYTKRRTLDGFRQNSSLSDPAHITNAYADGVSQLEIAQRQSVIYSFFHPKVKSILEMKQQLKTDYLQAKMNNYA
uniref:Complex 1 LYR protein domain-containing protein n=1 Tax=Chenopodium quinoa TaxID=63459 RepID=A0A803L9F6_CHEQI